MIRIRKILVLVDFSQNSEKAVQYGLEVARDRQARVFFLHMINQRIIDAVQELSSKGYKGDFIQALKKLVQDRENDLRQFVPEESRSGLEVEFLIRKGEPAEEVINVAKELSIDLIVVGSQGHTALATASIGSVAQNVVNHAPCPVLVIRPIEHDFID
jgi:universal stress protein A